MGLAKNLFISIIQKNPNELLSQLNKYKTFPRVKTGTNNLFSLGFLKTLIIILYLRSNDRNSLGVI